MTTAVFIRKLGICEFTHTDQNLENFTIVWFDATIDQTNDNLDTKARLRTVVNHLRTFHDAAACIKYLSSIENEKVLLIISGTLADMYISIVHQLAQVELIYIFCLDKIKYEALLINNKIRGVFAEKDPLILKLQEDAKLFARDIMPMNVFCLENDEHSIHDLTKGSALFLWNQLLIDVLLKMTTNEQPKTDLIRECRSYYRDNDEELKKIDDFHLCYSPDQAIS
ncbi:unnamed protein product [Didymodactylos carnosus]|uniref:Uncharacterized protein n=1 Tax=Didymodactylos carnosus TaxID=1234261 RepID=A0A814QR05_9BILA|nr:unnamed protein product [Didymodactylos carnosus]CAF3886019.1 unnamed protein product [Didymodactylos carnosus]